MKKTTKIVVSDSVSVRVSGGMEPERWTHLLLFYRVVLLTDF
jgi:hypothetical protein